jgi:hypothetical protein
MLLAVMRPRQWEIGVDEAMRQPDAVDGKSQQ